MSGAFVYAWLLGTVQERLKSPSQRWLIVGWSVAWLPLWAVYVHFAALDEHPYWIDWLFISLGTILWLVSCYGIYNLLFEMAETRWPMAREVRKLIAFLVKMLVLTHQHTP